MGLCLVSDAEVVLDAPEFMRVVGQDCAYPVWLVKYADCEGMPIDNDDSEWEGYYWYDEGFEWDDYLIEEKVDRCAALQAEFDDVLGDAGRYRKSRPRRSDVIRGSGHMFQLNQHRELEHSSLAVPQKRKAQRRTQHSTARLQRKMCSFAMRKAAGLQ